MTNPIQQLVDAARAYLQRETAERGFTLTAAILAVESAEVDTYWRVEWKDESGRQSYSERYTIEDAKRKAALHCGTKIVRIDTYRTVEKEQLLTPPAGEKGE